MVTDYLGAADAADKECWDEEGLSSAPSPDAPII